MLLIFQSEYKKGTYRYLICCSKLSFIININTFILDYNAIDNVRYKTNHFRQCYLGAFCVTYIYVEFMHEH